MGEVPILENSIKDYSINQRDRWSFEMNGKTFRLHLLSQVLDRSSRTRERSSQCSNAEQLENYKNETIFFSNLISAS